MVRVVVTTDAEAEELAGSALNLEPLDLQGTLEEPVAGLEVPVTSPQEMHTADGQEVSGGQPLQERLELVWMRERGMERERGTESKERMWRRDRKCEKGRVSEEAPSGTM